MKASRVTVSTLSAVLFYLTGQACATLEKPYEIAWIRQFGTDTPDHGTGISADAFGNVYISGLTGGSLSGPVGGMWDAFVSKYDSTGKHLWTRQFGAGPSDFARAVSTDALGNAYIVGDTNGALGGINTTSDDAFVIKYDPLSNLVWARQLRTNNYDLGRGVSVDGLGNVYISGFTTGSLGGPNVGKEDAFVAKYDSTGTLLWTRQFGTSFSDIAWAVSAEEMGNLYVTGYTDGSLGGLNSGKNDGFLSKFDSTGQLLWMRQLGTANDDWSRAVCADDGGNVFMAGQTAGSLGGPNAGKDDAFVTKYDSKGNLLWARQFGSTAIDVATDVLIDATGNMYVSGSSERPIGMANPGDEDAFIYKYDTTGNLLWTRQFGTIADEWVSSLSIDASGNLYITGTTFGSLGGQNVGNADVFVAKLVVPEPATFALLGLGFAAMKRMRHRSKD